MYYAMTPDAEMGAPAASRPAPMEEVRPQGHGVRHCGSGYELVLDATVPHMRKEDDDVLGEVVLQRNYKLISCWIDKLAGYTPAARDPGGGGGQAIAQEIPEVQVPRRRRVQQRDVRFEDVPVLHVPQERISERIEEQIVAVPQSSPQKRISERIVQTIPQKRTSKRIMEQTVDVPLQSIPQERISERIEEQIVDDVPGPARGGTLRAAAAASAAAECPDHGVFRTFPRKKKSATNRPESSAKLVSHSSSWPSAADAVPTVSEVAAPVQVNSVDEDPIYWRDEGGRLWQRSSHNPRKWHLYVKPDIVWEEPG